MATITRNTVTSTPTPAVPMLETVSEVQAYFDLASPSAARTFLKKRNVTLPISVETARLEYAAYGMLPRKSKGTETIIITIDVDDAMDFIACIAPLAQADGGKPADFPTLRIATARQVREAREAANSVAAQASLKAKGLR
jgi:hypothetical protein